MAGWKFSGPKKMVVILAVVLLVGTVKLVKRVTQAEERPSEGTTPKEKEEELLRIFHLDLKGAPPKLSFLLGVLPLVKEAGANAVLVEYEDMFPFSGKLRNASAGNAYSLGEVRQLVEVLEGMQMQVIPLVQSFGHLEYVLKLEEFRHLREVEGFPQEICPSRKEAVDMVKELIRQVMEVHKSSRYIHLGCDEIRHLSHCPRCSRMKPREVFSAHVVRMATHVRSRYPGVTPLIWDDMLRGWTYYDMVRSGLGSAVEPVVWVYGNDIFLLVPPFVWNVYLRTFPRLWVASAFKGAFGEREILPNLTRHLENNLSWKRMLAGKEKEVLFPAGVFSGIFLTGWSRYDHFAVLCELLPVAVPSLLLNLVFLASSSPEAETFSRWLTLLACPESPFRVDGATIDRKALLRSNLNICSFPGSNLYSGVLRFSELRARVGLATRKIDSSGWLSRYNLEKNFTSPWRLHELLPEEGFAGEDLRHQLFVWKASFLSLMIQYFDRWTTSEWEEQNVKPLEKKLEQIHRDVHELVRRKTWPRRPLG